MNCVHLPLQSSHELLGMPLIGVAACFVQGLPARGVLADLAVVQDPERHQRIGVT